MATTVYRLSIVETCGRARHLHRAPGMGGVAAEGVGHVRILEDQYRVLRPMRRGCRLTPV